MVSVMKLKKYVYQEKGNQGSSSEAVAARKDGQTLKRSHTKRNDAHVPKKDSVQTRTYMCMYKYVLVRTTVSYNVQYQVLEKSSGLYYNTFIQLHTLVPISSIC